MPQKLFKILGGKSSRVSKPSSSPKKSPQRRQRQQHHQQHHQQSQASRQESRLFEQRLDDIGAATLLPGAEQNYNNNYGENQREEEEDEVTLRDVVQAMRWIRAHMFTPMPQTGLHSTRVAELLRARASTPPLVAAGHLNAVLPSPTRTERELAELVSRGVVRKVRVARRGAVGEAVIEAADLERLVWSSGVSRATAEGFVGFLRKNPAAQSMASCEMDGSAVDELVRAGLLTSGAATAAADPFAPGSTLLARPEDRTTLTSIQHVSRFASGSVSAVGGHQAIHLAGGGGGGGGGGGRDRDSSSSSFPLRISLPGHGRYLKLAEGVLDWIRDTLAKTTWGEGPEDWLRERFEGGGLYGARWKEFCGVEWRWAVGLAAGLGVVEMFDTGSVGRGVRALG